MSDYISRADAIEAVASRDSTDGHTLRFTGREITDILSALPSADAVPQLKQTDTLIIADALRYLIKDTERHELDRTRAEELREQILQYGASMCKGGDEE